MWMLNFRNAFNALQTSRMQQVKVMGLEDSGPFAYKSEQKLKQSIDFEFQNGPFISMLQSTNKKGVGMKDLNSKKDTR